ncbi:MAG: Ig-like domain-containing protein, partial [Nitrospirae bacterium]|nr:Ig-like domain-containing protein [Nitrospirota bacterium]
MTAIYSFSYTTGDVGIPASTITSPANGAALNSASANPFTVSGSATDNIAVSGIEVSTNGGATWNAATCTGCPGANVTWTYSWTLPADGSYTIRSRATDSSSNVETPAAGNTVTIDRTAPTVSSTAPANGATNISLNSSVTINWSENVNCATVNTTNVTISGGGWTLSTCSGNQAVFTTSAQASSTTYTVTATTGVSDSAGNPM